MIGNSTITVGVALARHREVNGIEPGATLAAAWVCKIPPFKLELPNFSWRKAAILRHDLHHILTGFPCTVRGECQMAAWEFASGRFPDYRATLFCLPLVALGVLLAPLDTFNAFVLGRNSKSLYGRQFRMEQSLASVRDSTLPRSDPEARTRDHFAFIALFAASTLEIILPITVALALI